MPAQLPSAYLEVPRYFGFTGARLFTSNLLPPLLHLAYKFARTAVPGIVVPSVLATSSAVPDGSGAVLVLHSLPGSLTRVEQGHYVWPWLIHLC